MDAVILYVNQEDPIWLESYKKHVGGRPLVNRYRDWGTLPHLFRGIEKYLPYVEKVHLVVSSESQVPSWVNREEVHVVLHKDIIPEKYLPAWNSCTIELFIPFIEGLAEEFLYFNDDFFVVNPCPKELFFKDGRPQMQYKERSIKECDNTFRRQCLASTNAARSALNIPESDEIYLRLPHWPAPLKKSLCMEVWKAEKERILNSISKLRKPDNINQYLFLYYQLLDGSADNVRLPYLYFEMDRLDEIIDAITNTTQKEICLNDSVYADFEADKKKLIKAFEAKFPERSRFEVKQEEVIVSMTSYPARIWECWQVWRSVINQKTDFPFKCVMVLSEEEFSNHVLPFSLQRLIQSGKLEILWHKRNIRSHKKLAPVIKKYPDATIVTIDDDLIKPNGWLQGLMNDHRKYPDEIISGYFCYYLDSNFKWQRMLDFKQRHAAGKNGVPEIVFNFARLGSGSGTIYPAHSFTDERFYDEDLMMKLTATCDESWIWCFALLGGKQFRQSSAIYDESADVVEDSQKMDTALWRVNKGTYDEIYERIFNAFPEFKQLLLQQQRKYVVATKDVDEVRKKFPYHAVITTEDQRKIDALLTQYMDCPNKVAEFEGEKLYPPSIK